MSGTPNPFKKEFDSRPTVGSQVHRVTYRDREPPAPLRRVKSGRAATRVYDPQTLKRFFGRATVGRTGSGKNTKFLLFVLDTPTSDECLFWDLHFCGAWLEVAGRMGRLSLAWGCLEAFGWENIG